MHAPPFFALMHSGCLSAGELHEVWTASRICTCSLHGGHAGPPHVVPILVSVLLQRAPHPLVSQGWKRLRVLTQTPASFDNFPFEGILSGIFSYPIDAACLFSVFAPRSSGYFRFSSTSDSPVYQTSRSLEICKWRG